MKLSDNQKYAMFDCGIPQYMHGAIIRFYENGIAPGPFLTALINNDLKGTISHADDTNRRRIHSYIMWFHNEVPGGSWGYAGAVDKWIESFKDEGEPR